MPRVQITKEQWQIDRIYDFIIGQKAKLRITQNTLAKILGISQQSFSYKLLNRSFSLEEVLTLLNFFDVEITDCLRGWI